MRIGDGTVIHHKYWSKSCLWISSGNVVSSSVDWDSDFCTQPLLPSRETTSLVFTRADECLNTLFCEHRTISREFLDFWLVIDSIVGKYLTVSVKEINHIQAFIKRSLSCSDIRNKSRGLNDGWGLYTSLWQSKPYKRWINIFRSFESMSTILIFRVEPVSE